MGSEDPFRKTVQIIRDATARCHPIVVVSAPAGVTDDLERAASETRGDRATAQAWVRHIRRRFHALATTTLDDEVLIDRYETVLQTELPALRRALQSRSQSEPEATAARDAVLATGERLMAPLLAAALHARGCTAQAVDAASLIRTAAPPDAPSIRWEPTQQQVQAWFCRTVDPNAGGPVPVITGFIGGTDDGTTTTLGRGGSDLSAAVLARALAADRLERWTDVDGLYTRDPDTHEDARHLDRLNFQQARTWTRVGRLGMHPRTLDPLASANIPIHVRCTHHPKKSGTRIGPATLASQR